MMDIMMKTSVAKGIEEKTMQLSSDLYGQNALLVKSPGRINLIGEHTDYNNGFVLPAAIDKCICVAVAKREDEKILLFSVEFDENYEAMLSGLAPGNSRWPSGL
jgi:galactokinase